LDFSECQGIDVMKVIILFLIAFSANAEQLSDKEILDTLNKIEREEKFYEDKGPLLREAVRNNHKRKMKKIKKELKERSR
jgi:hypothetical protein